MRRACRSAVSGLLTSVWTHSGGQQYLNMQNREVAGRAYSFYREKLSGLSIAKIYTRFDSGSQRYHA